MKKPYYLLILVLLFSITAQAQTGWITKKLDDRLSVKFPLEPQMKTVSGVENYTAKARDSVNYGVTIIDYKVIANLDSATLAPMKDMQEFADQMKMGMASKMVNYTFGEVKIGKWKTYTSYNVTATENANKGKMHVQMILIGSKMYSLSCFVPTKVTTNNAETFFATAEMVK